MTAWHSMTYKLRLLGDPVLREVCQPFDRATDADALDTLVKAMATVVDRWQGYGLAANQVGAPVRVVVAKIDGVKRPLVTLINPVIFKTSFSKRPVVEACLSVPGFSTHKVRFDRVTVAFDDALGVPQERSLAGLEAQMVQHECDHLEGILIVDGRSEKHVRRAEELTERFRAKMRQGEQP